MVARTKEYVPERGDLVWISFDLARGHEQKGRRPAVVVSPLRYNDPSGLALLCPVTSKSKPYPFVVPLDAHGITGAVLTDHIRSVDWHARRVEKIGRIPKSTLTTIQGNLGKLIVD